MIFQLVPQEITSLRLASAAPEPLERGASMQSYSSCTSSATPAALDRLGDLAWRGVPGEMMRWLARDGGTDARLPVGSVCHVEGMEMDAIVLLREDHKTVEKLFKRFERTGDDDLGERRSIVDEVIQELTVHAWIEERIFYPAAREAAPKTTDHILESIEEHHAVVWMLSELKDMDPADERFKAKMTVLMENVRHHVEEEEKEWFPDVRKAMGRNRLTEVGEQLEAEKSKASRDPLAVPSAAGK